MSDHKIPFKKDLFFFLFEPLRLTPDELIVLLKWICVSLIFGSIPMWLPLLIQVSNSAKEDAYKPFVLNGNLMAFLVIVLVERLFSIYFDKKKKKIKIKMSKKSEDVENNSKNLILIFIVLGMVCLCISLGFYLMITLVDMKISDIAQWSNFIFGLIVWIYLVCFIINERWEDSVNTGYTIEKDNRYRDDLVQADLRETGVTKTGVKL